MPIFFKNKRYFSDQVLYFNFLTYRCELKYKYAQASERWSSDARQAEAKLSLILW